MTKWMPSLKTYARSIAWWIYEFSSVRFIVEKAVPSGNPIPPNTFLIWAVGIYIAAYSLATGLHESRRSSLERRVSSLTIQLQSGDKRAALKKIAKLQQVTIPPRPRFGNYGSLHEFLRSILSPLVTIATEDVDKEIVQQLKEIVETYKRNLVGADLSNADLSYTDLSNGKMNGAILTNADLSNSDLSNVIGKKANFAVANLRNANFTGSTLDGSIFDLADMSGTKFTFSSLKDASFYRVTTTRFTDWIGAILSEVNNIDSDDLYYLKGCFDGEWGWGDAIASNSHLYVGCYMPIFNVRLDRSKIDIELYDSEVRRLVKLLGAWPELSIMIMGHTHEMGSSEYNLELGDRFATSLRDYLTSKGIALTRLNTMSYGEERPIDNSKSPYRHLKNHRVEVELVIN